MKTLLAGNNLVLDPPEPGCALCLSGLPGGSGYFHDRSPYGNHGTINGAQWVKLPGGLWSLQLDGVDDRVQCADSDSLDIVDNITILTWVKRSNTNRRDIVVAKKEGGSGFAGFILEIVADAGRIDCMQFYYQNSNGDWENNIISQCTVDTGWHQIAVTRSPQKIRFSLDGKLDPNEYVPSLNMNAVNSHNVVLGGVSTVPYFAGGIALFRLYNRSLSALEIQNAFFREKSMFGVW